MKSMFLCSEELLAQGLLSFSELRSHALPPRWYLVSFYLQLIQFAAEGLRFIRGVAIRHV